MSALAETLFARRAVAPAAAAGQRRLATVTVAADFAAIEGLWRALERTALLTPYQSFDWVAAYAETIGAADAMDFRHAVVCGADGRALAILPLVVTRRQGCRFAEFIGGKHANYHMGVYEPDFARSLDGASVALMLREIAAAIGGLDALAFVNQPVAWGGQANPAALLAKAQSPSHSYKLALTAGDCDGALRRAMSGHAHKKIKNKRNRLASFGTAEVVRPVGTGEIERTVDAFLRQKANRFAALGLPDPFVAPAVRAFLCRGAEPRGGHAPAIELYAMEIAGRTVASYVGAVQGTRFSGMATAFDIHDEVAKSSPGEILLVDLIRLKCAQGIAVFDLGVGEARYKTTICDDRDELVDGFLPLTPLGRLFAGVAAMKRTAKRAIKRSPLALRLAHRASLLLRRPPAAAQDE